MSAAKKSTSSGALLDLWRAPEGAGDPIGCLATTYMFKPGLFDEQCLARFLGIESEPNRESLAFLLERESLLGSVYAGVLVDHAEAGVEHSLRWDVLPVRVKGGKQHAKLSLLAWAKHIRIIVASANLTEPGYRTNYEVASAIELDPEDSDNNLLGQSVDFLRDLIRLVPGASAQPSHVVRAEAFLDQLARLTRDWESRRREAHIRQELIFTLPEIDAGRPRRSSLERALRACRRKGAAPDYVWVASPFFDSSDQAGRVVSALCKGMSRCAARSVVFDVPAFPDEHDSAVPRLSAPKTLIDVPRAYRTEVSIETLLEKDPDKNPRQWHAKMMAFGTASYFGVMVGSSNFTCAGLGVGLNRNAEANLLTLVDEYEHARIAGKLAMVWPEVKPVDEPESAEWLGSRPENEEEDQKISPPLPAGFLSATFRSGAERRMILCFDAKGLPEDWAVFAFGQDKPLVLNAEDWRSRKEPSRVELVWQCPQPPDKLLVQWDDKKAPWVVNVEDPSNLPPPAQLDQMTADDMLLILAASDPSAAFRIWSRRLQPEDITDTVLDSGTPIDLDPLRRYDLQTTFLHRIRNRARVLAQLRANLQRPVWGRQSLEWKLRGLIGVEALAGRLLREFEFAGDRADEALLTLADYLIVLHDVDYRPAEGSLSKTEFDKVFGQFLRDLTEKIDLTVAAHRERVPENLMHFWKRVCERCQQ